MREILFKGKRVDNGEWVESDCFFQCDGEVKLWDNPNRDGWVNVKPETIGQYTGLTDKNGTKIFEGDIVKLSSELTLDNFDGFIGQVKFELGGFNIVNGYKGDSVFQDCRDIEVIGNVFDNGDLTIEN